MVSEGDSRNVPKQADMESDKSRAQTMRLIKEGEEESEESQPVPETAVASRNLAHEAGSAENKIVDLQNLQREFGLDPKTNKALEITREQIYGEAKAQDKAANLVKMTLGEQLIRQANQAINGRSQPAKERSAALNLLN